MVSIVRYNKKFVNIWNEFNESSKNYLFMFDRGYMEYHSDRFVDHSLMFYKENCLIALLPISEDENGFISHGGLTYGGFITNEKMKQHIMNECVLQLIEYMKNNNVLSLKYKCIPEIYHLQLAEEDRYSLFAVGAKILTVDAATFLNLNNPLKMPKGRKAQISRAKRENVTITILTELEDYIKFIDLENEVLSERHSTKAVHTAKEMKMLHDRFPQNIHLFAAQKEGVMLAGTIVYEYDDVVHTQYMAANDEARKIGALDLTINVLIEYYKGLKKWLDFGISTEHNRIYLNEGLIAQKEGFGGRTGVYETWLLQID